MFFILFYGAMLQYVAVMAFYVTRKQSPFYYLCHKDAMGRRRQMATRFYHDRGAWEEANKRQWKYPKKVAMDGRWKQEQRRAELFRLEATAKEQRHAIGGGRVAEWDKWVPNFIINHWFHPSTRKEVMSFWNWFEPDVLMHLGIDHPAQLTYEMFLLVVERILEVKPNVRRATIAKDWISRIKIIMNEAVKREYCPTNPTVNFILPGVEKKSNRIKAQYLDREIDMIWAELSAKVRSPIRGSSGKPVEPWPDYMKRSFALGLYHGVRIKETRMEPHQVDLDRGVVHFNTTKTRDWHTVPIMPLARPFMEHIAKRGNGLEYSPNSMSPHFSDMLKRIGLGHHRFHDTRATCITRMALAGVPEQLAKRYVNHASSLVHEIYVQIKPEELGAVSRSLHAAFGGTSLPHGTLDALPANQETYQYEKSLPLSGPSAS